MTESQCVTARLALWEINKTKIRLGNLRQNKYNNVTVKIVTFQDTNTQIAVLSCGVGYKLKFCLNETYVQTLNYTFTAAVTRILSAFSLASILKQQLFRHYRKWKWIISEIKRGRNLPWNWCSIFAANVIPRSTELKLRYRYLRFLTTLLRNSLVLHRHNNSIIPPHCPPDLLTLVGALRSWTSDCPAQWFQWRSLKK